jgi:hypothetical protein
MWYFEHLLLLHLAKFFVDGRFVFEGNPGQIFWAHFWIVRFLPQMTARCQELFSFNKINDLTAKFAQREILLRHTPAKKFEPTARRKSFSVMPKFTSRRGQC